MDIFEGITSEQARQMAENLEFKGPALDEVKSIVNCKNHVSLDPYQLSDPLWSE